MFQRMLVIPQEEYLQLTAVQAAKQPMARQIQNLSTEYEEQGEIRDPYRRLIRQAETLDTMKVLKEKMRQQIVMAAPKPYQSRTRSLFQHLEPILKLNERGEIFDEHNQPIPDSRIEDLIQHAVRDRRRYFVPTGWDSFLRTLHANNIPKYMLNRNTLDELEGRSGVKTLLQTPIKTDISKKPTKRGTLTKAKGVKRIKREALPIKQRPKREVKKPRKYEFLQF